MNFRQLLRLFRFQHKYPAQVLQRAIGGPSGHPMLNSSDVSSGVPQRRHMTDEQSPQVSGSITAAAQTGQ
jgi:hypothetical protein